MKRPWSGQQEAAQIDDIPEFDPNNPLCPGVVRGNGEVKSDVRKLGWEVNWSMMGLLLQKNPDYISTFVFTNDFPALLEDITSPDDSDDPLFQIKEAKGTCRVMCFHPKSNKTLPTMTVDIKNLMTTWWSCRSDKYEQIQNNNEMFLFLRSRSTRSWRLSMSKASNFSNQIKS